MAKRLTRNEKYDIASQAMLRNEKVKTIAERYGVSSTNVCQWIKQVKQGKLKGSVRDAKCKRAKPIQFLEVERAVVRYIDLRQQRYVTDGLGLSWLLLQERAKEICEKLHKRDPSKGYDKFRASTGWFEKVRKRNNIRSIGLHGEGGTMSLEHRSSVMSVFKDKLAATGVTDPRYIFNADQTGLFYQCLPSRTYTTKRDNTLRGVKPMASKTRITLMTATSCAGVKLPLFAVGKSMKPRCFKGRKPAIRYMNQQNAWFDTLIANLWVRIFLKWKKKMYGDHCKVVLILDNCSCHKKIDNPSPEEVEILFLPPNVTSNHQPMDMGLIAALKVNYKRRVLQKLLKFYDAEEAYAQVASPSAVKGLSTGSPPNLLDALQLCKEEWDKIATVSVQRCWRKAECLPEQLRVKLNLLISVTGAIPTATAATATAARTTTTTTTETTTTATATATATATTTTTTTTTTPSTSTAAVTEEDSMDEGCDEDDGDCIDMDATTVAVEELTNNLAATLSSVVEDGHSVQIPNYEDIGNGGSWLHLEEDADVLNAVIDKEVQTIMALGEEEEEEEQIEESDAFEFTEMEVMQS